MLAQSRDVLAAGGVADRCVTVGADFLDAVPTGGDLYVLSNIIHDWDDDAATRILRTCHRAMAVGARLLIVELVLPDDTQPSPAKLLDLEMLSVTPSGRQRTAREYGTLLKAAGFRMTRVVPAVMGTPASYVEATLSA